MKAWVRDHHEDERLSALMPRIMLYRVTRPLDLAPEVYPPFISLILQGEKQLQIGTQSVHYRAGELFIAATDMPATGRVTVAEADAPYLAVRLTLDFALLSDLICTMPATADAPLSKGMAVLAADDMLLAAWLRLLRLRDHPADIAVLAPLAERELLYRLLCGPQGQLLRQAADVSSHFSAVQRPISWLKSHYAQPVRMAALAGMANMSLSVFHRRFKAVTGLTPLQYQKHLRLYAARSQLLLMRGKVAAVAASVGYESLTQFTREYARLFGDPPARDSRRHRQ